MINPRSAAATAVAMTVHHFHNCARNEFNGGLDPQLVSTIPDIAVEMHHLVRTMRAPAAQTIPGHNKCVKRIEALNERLKPFGLQFGEFCSQWALSPAPGKRPMMPGGGNVWYIA